MSRCGYKWLMTVASCLSCLVFLGCGAGEDLIIAGSAVLHEQDRGSSTDTDGDGIADTVEAALGTDPTSIDTDYDGLTDHYELWGIAGLPVGQVGSLADLPDQDRDGVIAALDRDEVGKELLKSTSALDNDRIRVSKPGEPFLANDQDRDYIPSDFELHGFYYEIDPLTGEDWFVKWDGDISREYYMTDPTKWSTDADPWSDWEEATKRNLDQRVKWPGDHPCIPAYPELYVSLVDYRIDLNEDSEITTTTGRTTEHSWTNSVEKASREDDIYIGIGGEEQVGGLKEWDSGGNRLGGVVLYGWLYGIDGSYEYDSNVTTKSRSGIESQEWSNAELTAGNSLEAARITLNLRLLNTGTLPASNPVILVNLLLGNVPITNFQVTYEGELKPMVDNVVETTVKTDGFSSEAHPLGQPLMLSLNQLRSIECGAPLNIEVVGFEADTLVWEVDPETGSRLYITTGDWSPYKSAIENVTARVALDFNDHPLLSPPLYDGMTAKRVSDVRVFGYDNTGNYVGSPPRTTLADAFIWAFEAKNTAFGPLVTIRDPISRLHYQSYLVGWSFGLDRQLVEELIEDPDKYGGGLFDIPLFPGNPDERVYLAKAPLDDALAKPTIYWANVIPSECKVRAYSFDVNGVKEMRFKPEEGYAGEVMTVGFDPNDPESQFFHYYDIPSQYHWTGLEKVVAVNRLGVETEMDIQIVGDQLGYLVACGSTGTGWDYSASTIPLRLNIEAEGIGELKVGETDPADLVLSQEMDGGQLKLVLEPGEGALYNIEAVKHPDQLEYNYLRKCAYQKSGLAVDIDAPLFQDDLFESGTAKQWSNVYAVSGRFGSVAILVPELQEAGSPGSGEWYVAGITWAKFEGI